jgi:Ca2+-binding RTX toxin-like protein
VSKRQQKTKEKQRRHRHSASGKQKLVLGTGLTIGATFAMGGVAHATDFTVDNTGDTGGSCPTTSTCTLRQAINDANTVFGPDNILFDSSLTGTITLGSALPTITDPTDIYGPGAGQLAVSGNDASRVFTINQSVAGDPVSITDLTMTDGDTPSGGGAVISADADLTITDSVISGSDADFRGGGISSYGPSLTVERSTVSGNTAMPVGCGFCHGGGIYAYSELHLADSTVSGNTGGGYGGGVYVGYSGGPGGDQKGPHTIVNSTIVGNTAGRDGGGVNFYGSYYAADQLTIESSTITGNNASGADGRGFGGGVASLGAESGNSYLGSILQNTIVANNTAAMGNPDVDGDLADASFNLIEDPGSVAISEGVPGSNITGVDPLLLPLADNGGSTQTQAIAFNTSPALDAGMSAQNGDQRSLPRPFDLPTIANSSAPGADGSDIGAVEMQTLPPEPPGGSPTAVAPKCKGKVATVFRANGRTLTGTNKRDVIVGTKKKDKINSRGGNDLVCAKGGNDTVNGGGGKDKLFGQGGKDKLSGKGGKDKLVGGAKKDKLIGGAGADKLLGKGGNDTCVGGPGKDVEKSC